MENNNLKSSFYVINYVGEDVQYCQIVPRNWVTDRRSKFPYICLCYFDPNADDSILEPPEGTTVSTVPAAQPIITGLFYEALVLSECSKFNFNTYPPF